MADEAVGPQAQDAVARRRPPVRDGDAGVSGDFFSVYGRVRKSLGEFGAIGKWASGQGAPGLEIGGRARLCVWETGRRCEGAGCVVE